MKTVFIDCDGVIAEYCDCNDKVCVKEFGEGFFLNKLPVAPVISKILYLYNDYELYILSASPHEQATKEKNKWLDKYFPISKNRRFIIKWKEETKAEFIKNYIKENKIKKENVILIDDEHDILRECEKIGIQVYHISRLLTLKKEGK